jgi:hypothetical protein
MRSFAKFFLFLSLLTLAGDLHVCAQTRAAVTYMGTWSSSVKYNLNEMVVSGGVTYISLVPNNLNYSPASSPSDWVVLGGGSGITQLTGDVAAGAGSGSQAATVQGLKSVPFCTGFTPTNGQQIQYTTASTPNPCYTAATPSGGGGVQYNPSNTLYVFTGNSVMGDDTQVLAPQITVTGGSCNATVCTITNSGTNGLSAGDWIYQGMVGMPATPAPFGTVSTTYGFFQVLSTGLSSTQFEFNYPSTATITGGTVQKANYFLAQQVMQQPFFKGHGSFQIVTDASYYVANIDSDYTALFHSISPAATGNNPEYLIINDIFNNDLQGCATAATIEGHLQSIWAKAHTDGWIVVQGTATAAPYNSSSCATAYTNTNVVNNWLYAQGKTTGNTTGASNGKYWDTLADVGAVLSNPIDTNLIATNGGMAPGGVQPYTQTLNEAMSSQASATKAKSYSYFGASAVGGNTRGEVHTPLADSYHAFVVTDAAQDTEDLTVDTLRHAIYVNNMNAVTSTTVGTNSVGGAPEGTYIPSLSTGRSMCRILGTQNAAQDAWVECLNYSGDGSTSNSVFMGLIQTNNYTQWVNDTNNFVFYDDGSFLVPGGILGPATAPTGSCPRVGAWVHSQNGAITYCPPSGTWTTYGGGSTNPAVLSQATYNSSTRLLSTVYHNTSSYPMLVWYADNSNSVAAVTDSSASPTTQVWALQTYSGAGNPAEFVVMPGNYYKITGSSFGSWNEYTFNTGTMTQSGDLVGSRSLGTTYHNTGSGFMIVEVVTTCIYGNGTISVDSDSSSTPTTLVYEMNSIEGSNSAFFIVPAGYYYNVPTAAGTSVVHWNEYTSSLPATMSANLFTAPAQRYMVGSTGLPTPPPVYGVSNPTGHNKFVTVVWTAGGTGTAHLMSDIVMPPIQQISGFAMSGGSVGTLTGIQMPNTFLSAWRDNSISAQTSWVEYTLGP